MMNILKFIWEFIAISSVILNLIIAIVVVLSNPNLQDIEQPILVKGALYILFNYWTIPALVLLTMYLKNGIMNGFTIKKINQ